MYFLLEIILEKISTITVHAINICSSNPLSTTVAQEQHFKNNHTNLEILQIKLSGIFFHRLPTSVFISVQICKNFLIKICVFITINCH